MAENYLLPGYYNLKQAVISNYEGKQIDIKNMIPSFSIIESIANDSLRGNVDMLDTIGFLEDFPLRGEESLQLVVEDPFQNEKIFDLFVYKISDISIKDSNDGVSYKMHFTSYARFQAGLRRVRAPYENTISYIANDIFTKYYGDTKPIEVEDTEGSFRCVIPNYTPIQTMMFLSSRAYSTQSPSCSFRFFENNESFYFVSDEYLIKKAQLNDGQDIKEYTFSDAIPKSGEQFLAQMQNLTELRNSDRSNTVNDLYSGAYTNNVIELDLVKRKLTDKRFKYSDDKNRYTETGTSQDVHSDKFIEDIFNEENERRFLLIKDYTTLGDDPSNIRGEQYLSEITSNRLAYRHRLNNTVVNARAYGRLDLKAGDIIRLVIPEFTSNSDKKLNPQLSGNYILHTLTHNMVHDSYEIGMKLVKYDWSA
jgi:hypothetical protein